VQRLWQPLCHVASLMNLATLDWCVGTEGPTNDLAQRLGTVDDEQPADLWVEPAFDDIAGNLVMLDAEIEMPDGGIASAKDRKQQTAHHKGPAIVIAFHGQNS